MTEQEVTNANDVRYGSETVGGVKVFYREAGRTGQRAIVLLHGYPASSHMYRDVVAALGKDYYVVAPDYPGFGNSDAPESGSYDYTFENLANTIEALLEQKEITEYVLGMQDYGAPVGYRLATRHPERVKGLVVMNGNAYEEGFHPENSAPVRDYWKGRTPEKDAAIVGQLMSAEGVQWMYTHGTQNPAGINPDSWVLDAARLARSGQERIQLDLFYDYRTNVELYPEWHAFLRDHQPPTLIAWGKNDPIFIAEGAEAYRQHLDEIDFHLFDTGHFVLEEEGPQVIAKMRDFLRRNHI